MRQLAFGAAPAAIAPALAVDRFAFLAEYSGGYKACTECKGITPSGFPTG